jgi:outer membrane protein assembly factor BamA
MAAACTRVMEERAVAVVGLHVKTNRKGLRILRRAAAVAIASLGLVATRAALAQGTATTNPTAAPTTRRASLTPVPPELIGRPVESVRVLGNIKVPTAVILNVVRTREGEKFDPATVEEDYQRIFGLKRFSNVEAKVEPTRSGVIVVFAVTEQKQITSIAYHGNREASTSDIEAAVDMRKGEAIDDFRIAMAKQAIERFYRDENFPYAHVDVPMERLDTTGELVFNITEGPHIRIRRVNFEGNRSFTADRLRDQIHTAYWIWIFRAGTFDPEQVEDDVASLRRYYQDKGFFDAKVGRKLAFSADQTEMQVTFVIEEGPRYTVDRVSFTGNVAVSEADLRKNLNLTEGRPFDAEVLQRDVREVVRAYSPFGYIYLPRSTDPDYLRIGKPEYTYGVNTIFRRDAGKVELVYEIHEGKPFRMGRIIVKGNNKTQEKVILREMHVAPDQLYDSAEIADAQDRLRGTPYFQSVSITPIGDQPDFRDLLVEVTEARTASFTVGAGVNSNGGVAGNITYEQRNFDIANWPSSWRDMFSERAFVGAGQDLRISFEPGTQFTNADIRFTEPWLFDQPYSFSNDLYYRDRAREAWEETRFGDRMSFGHRFSYVWSGLISLRGEDVDIHDIDDPPRRAPQILELAGHSTVTSAGPSIRRDTTNHGPIPYRGTNTVAGWEHAGALGGDFIYDRFTAAWDGYITVDEDLLDRKTVLGLHLDSGYISGSPPFYDAFYGGGIGSIRGFAYRGVSPRAGLGEDPIGGNFIVTGSAELGFPLIGDNFRGVIFSDAGDVEPQFHFGTIRTSVGFGIRLVLPVFGQAPLALDFAFPLSKNSQDETQIISFSFGIIQ